MEEGARRNGSAGGSGSFQRELGRGFAYYNKHLGRLQQNLRDTKRFFRDIKHTYGGVPGGPDSDLTTGDLGQLNCISFSRHEEDYLKVTVRCRPCLFVLGQNCGARSKVVNALLGDHLLPIGVCCNPQTCKRRRIRFRHGQQTLVSLALPEQYELVHQLVAHKGKWHTIPDEDLEVPEDEEDPAHRLAELEVTLPHQLLQDVDIVVSPCRGSQPATTTLEDYVDHVQSVVVYAISEDLLSPQDEEELTDIKAKYKLPVFFIRTTKDKLINSSEGGCSELHEQLTELGYLKRGLCSCGAAGSGSPAPNLLVEQFDKLRQLGSFSRQVLQMHLVDAAMVLNMVHSRCLDLFINKAFDMRRDLQITPKRLEYTRQKESELYESLMRISDRKQEELKDMIVETLNSMREQLLEDAANMEFKGITIPQNGEPIGVQEVKSCIFQIKELIISRLNQAVVNKLISSVDYLRESFVGTLERCLRSLERSQQESSSHVTSNHLKQILNAAYHVEVTFNSGSTVTRMVWEQIVQIIQRITWVSPPSITPEWKRKVAQDAMEGLSASKLAKRICSQFCKRLKSSHEAFAASLKQLEVGHSGRLEKTEDLWLKVRKDHAPRLARLSLESRSLRDVLLHGKPRLGRELGRGQYGVVYLCDSWGGHFPCALKSVVPPDEKHWNDLALEFHYMRSLPKHERLVDLHGSVIDYSYGGGSSIAVLLITERLHRDLYAGLKSELSLETRLQIALDVVEGIRFLHSQGLVHRDIKLKNVLLDKTNRAKITDLGFCKPEAMMSGSIVGTPIHMAPELFSGKYDNSVDVYAFGILFWYICSGSVKLPEAFERCSSKDHLWNNVRKGARPERLPVFDEECWKLMEACWNGDPSQRPLLGIVQPMLQGIMDRLCRSQESNKNLEDST
ncbi:dual serine/threonine and tyrosine protein kinase [Hyla sarda]|uniref:dual serine/threonine and tyrosine protein kinase n=1 Tax=Hyla sarda TaxID=327740 RepID=UPI0024C3CDA3|nr:dual serine/threonine and tyrosine protein kinase [Hyla sarda]